MLLKYIGVGATPAALSATAKIPLIETAGGLCVIIAAEHDPTSVTRCAVIPSVATGNLAASGLAVYVKTDQTATDVVSLHVSSTQEQAMSEIRAITVLALSVLPIAADEVSFRISSFSQMAGC